MKPVIEHIKEIIFFGLLIFVIFFNNHSSKAVDYSAEIKAKDETIEAMAKQRDIYREWKDEAVKALLQKDSVLKSSIKINTIKYEKIPATVRSYDNDELRRAIENY